MVVDCDDGDSLINPGMDEVLADGLDNNCDGFVDVAVENVANDLDGHYEGLDPNLCVSSVQLYGVNDCDDTDPTVSFNAFEWFDGIDNDCNRRYR